MEHIEPQTRSPRLLRHATRRLLIGLGTAAALTAGALAVSASPAAAVQRNNLHAEISGAADVAVTELDAYSMSGDIADYLDYAEARAATARLAARELGYNEFAMISAWQRSPLEHQRAVLSAMTQVGVPYRSHTSIEDTGFDCSGLTTYAWSEAGHQLVRQSGGQISDAERLDRATAKAGDLVHYPGHVMMYLGVGDAVIHSVATGRSVEVDTISERRRNSVRWGDPTL